MTSRRPAGASSEGAEFQTDLKFGCEDEPQAEVGGMKINVFSVQLKLDYQLVNSVSLHCEAQLKIIHGLS